LGNAADLKEGAALTEQLFALQCAADEVNELRRPACGEDCTYNRVMGDGIEGLADVEAKND
jgi:hypothetical protein